MKKQWQVPDSFRMIAGGVWLLGWVPLGIMVQTIFGGCDSGGCGMNATTSGASAPLLIFIGAWFGVVVVPAMLIGARLLIASAWEHRPRRIVKPIVTDLRAVYPGESQARATAELSPLERWYERTYNAEHL